MNNLYPRIIDLIPLEERIPLDNGNFYLYRGATRTRINGQLYQGFLYEISSNDRKRVSINLIHSLYEQRLRTEIMPTKAEMFILFPFELCSRPCNYTVAAFIVNQLIQEDQLNR